MPKILFKDNSVFFIHIPKTGGTSLYGNLQHQGAVIEDYSPHKPISAYSVTSHHLDQLQIEEYFGNVKNKFTIIRDPWKRTLSDYVYRTKDPTFKKLNQWLLVNLTLFKTNPCRQDNHFKPMTSFISENTTVFLFERLNLVHQWLCKQLDYDFKFTSVYNQSRLYTIKPIEKLITPQVAELWFNHYSADIKLYNSLDIS